MDSKSHKLIAAGLKAGNSDAWRALYDAYAGPIWRQVARLMADQSAVNDVVQETFLAAARSARTYHESRGTLWVWLWTIARRQIALHYRKQKPTVSLDQALEWWGSLDGRQAEILQQLEAPPDIAANRELALLVRESLAQLTPEYETLLVAKYMEDKPVKDISDQLNCSTEAVRSKLARARKAFRTTFVNLVGIDPSMGD